MLNVCTQVYFFNAYSICLAFFNLLKIKQTCVLLCVCSPPVPAAGEADVEGAAPDHPARRVLPDLPAVPQPEVRGVQQAPPRPHHLSHLWRLPVFPRLVLSPEHGLRVRSGEFRFHIACGVK